MRADGYLSLHVRDQARRLGPVILPRPARSGPMGPGVVPSHFAGQDFLRALPCPGRSNGKSTQPSLPHEAAATHTQARGCRAAHIDRRGQAGGSEAVVSLE